MAEQNNAAEDANVSGVAPGAVPIRIAAGSNRSVVVPNGGHRTLIVQGSGGPTTTIEVDAS
jgi:hypothetical protein